MWKPKLMRQFGAAADAVTELRDAIPDPDGLQSEFEHVSYEAREALREVKTAAQIGSVCFVLLGVVALVALGTTVALLARETSR